MPCCKFSLIHCRLVRNPPSCKLNFRPSCCTKRPTKYPSFSECRKHELQEPIPFCERAKKHSICDMWAYYRRRYRGW